MISIIAAIFMMDMIATHVDAGYNAHDEGYSTDAEWVLTHVRFVTDIV